MRRALLILAEGLLFWAALGAVWLALFVWGAP
jgi:hypothetical protein